MLLSERDIQECDEAINLLNTGRAAESAQKFTDILIKNEDNPLAWCNRGLALLQLGHPFDAVLNLQRAVDLAPKQAEYLMNLGAAYAEYEQFDKAISWYRKSLEMRPDLAHAHMNLGNALKMKGHPDEAIFSYRRAVSSDPTYVDAHLNRAFAELGLGNFEIGWEEFEWRWKSAQLPERGLRIAPWDGSDLNGKTLLIYAEQGFGDALHFVRYASLVKEKYDCRVIVEVRQPLTRLMQGVEGVDEVITYGELVPEKAIDYMVAMMSLPRIFGTHAISDIPWNGPYFKADAFRSALWLEKLKALPPGLRVGICWAGQSRPGRPHADAVDRKRSTTLSAFAPLAAVPGISWVSLQKGIPRDQIEKPPAGMTIGDWTEELYDFYDTAALIDCLDLVISVDTAVIHLAAALGKPTWLLSRWDGCWRWLGNRSDSPWYPSLRQFCQPGPNDWGSVMGDAAIALQKFVEERKSQHYTGYPPLSVVGAAE